MSYQQFVFVFFSNYRGFWGDLLIAEAVLAGVLLGLPTANWVLLGPPIANNKSAVLKDQNNKLKDQASVYPALEPSLGLGPVSGPGAQIAGWQKLYWEMKCQSNRQYWFLNQSPWEGLNSCWSCPRWVAWGVANQGGGFPKCSGS